MCALVKPLLTYLALTYPAKMIMQERCLVTRPRDAAQILSLSVRQAHFGSSQIHSSQRRHVNLTSYILEVSNRNLRSEWNIYC
jgi:hypothetical protein